MTVRVSNHERAGRAAATAVVVTAVFMSNLDLWIVNVALVAIGRGLHGSLASLSWVLSAYAVTLAALLIPAGRIGDRIGHRKTFLGGMALFTLASGACAAAPDLPVLIAARTLQAAGAAALQLPPHPGRPGTGPGPAGAAGVG